MMIPNCSKRILIRLAALGSVFVLTLALNIRPGETAQVPSPPRATTPPQPQTPPGQPAAPLPSVKAVTVLAKGAIQMGGLVKASATGGQEVGIRVELTGPAPCVTNCGKKTLTGQPSGWMPVMLSSSNPGVANLQGLAVPTGQTYGELRFVPSPVSVSTSLVISAWTQGSAPQSAGLTILPPILTNFVLDQASVLGGTTVHGALHFNGPPASAGAVKVQLSTTNSAAVKIPATVALEPNRIVANFDIPTLGVGQDTTVHVVATYQDRILPAPITVRAAALKGIVSLGIICGNPGQTGFRVDLTGPAGPQGAAVSVSSSDPVLLAFPPSLIIPAQQSEGAITIPVTQLLSAVTVTVSYYGKSDKTTINATSKPDLFVKSVSFYDRYGNAISRAQDSEPFKMRVAVSIGVDDAHFVCLLPPPTTLHVSYLSPTGIGTSSGRSFEVPISSTGGTIDIDLPGLQPGSYHEITLTADYRKQVDERSESNNTEKIKINGPNP